MAVYNTNMRAKQERITIERLATIVARGFEDVSGRLDGVSSRLGKVEDEVTDVKEELKKIVTHMDTRIDGLELKISSASASWVHEFDRLHDWIEELDGRVNKIENKIIGR